MTAESLVANAPGKGVNMSGRSECEEGAHLVGFPAQVISYQGKVSGEVTEAGLKIGAPGGDAAQGVFVPFKQDYATVGVLSGGECFFVSDQFGGCDFTVLKTADGRWAGSHVYSSDTCREAIAAVPEGWTNVYTWRSGPYARMFGMGGGSINVVCFVTGSHLKFVMLRIRGYPPTVAEARLSASVVL